MIAQLVRTALVVCAAMTACALTNSAGASLVSGPGIFEANVQTSAPIVDEGHSNNIDARFRVAQTACPPGFDGSSGRCVRNSDRGSRRSYGGTACPPGYDPSGGQCVPNNTYGGGSRHRGGYYRGATCPPGYDGSSGQCIPNNSYGGYGRRQGGYYGAVCPPGYDGRSGECYPNR